MILILSAIQTIYFRKAICNEVSNTILVLVLNTMILILNAIQTILLSQSNMQSSFQYHIGIGIEYNDIDFECNTNDFMFAK